MQDLDIRLTAEGERLRINAPRGALSAALRQRLAAEKATLLNYLREVGEPYSPHRESEIPLLVGGQPVPLSFAQERLWFLEQFEPGTAVFNLCRGLRITGPLEVAALEASVSTIVQRHEILRTKFLSVDGRPQQWVASLRPLRLKVIDLSRLTPGRQAEKLERVQRVEATRPFDLSGGRLLRLKLLRFSGDVHQLLICLHHLAADGWSMGIFTGELWAHYNCYVKGETPTLAPLPLQYRDYAAWQRRVAPDVESNVSTIYWRRQLADAPLLDLPCDFPRPARLSSRGARQPLEFSEPLTAALNGLSRRESVTPFMILLAAFQVLLHRYSGQEDIVVGAPLANRERRALESSIGLFVNTVALRGDLSGGPSFREFLRRVREVCLDGQAHHNLPFEKLVGALQPERQLNRHPLFQALLVLQNTPRPTVTPNGIAVEAVEVDNHAAQFELSLYLRERDGKLLGYFEYSSDLFSAATLARMAGHFATLLQAIVDDPQQSIARLALLNPAQREQLLVEWNRTAADFPGANCIHQLFEAQVERTPDAIAVQFGARQSSYRDLNRRANQIAHHLRRLDVGVEMRVGLFVDRSLEMVVGLLAILKAGAAYVPLDEEYPEARLKFMLDDAQLALVLTKKIFARSSCLDNVKTICLDDEALFASESGVNPNSGVTALNAAYVIYTSGSTGSPKGVVGLHRGAVNRFAWMWRRYPFTANDVCCAKTSLSFVDSVWEIFGPLLQGVRLVIAADAVARQPSALIALLASRQVTRIVLVPSLLQAFLDQTPSLAKALPRLRLWTCSGETLSAGLAARFRKSFPRALLLNLYGSSEVAADVTCFECTGAAVASVPIGRPIDNTQVFLLDSNLQPVPLGVRGEIYVGGAGLARGYWRRPELNAEKFVANPFDASGNSPLFRTGDLGRYLADGNLEYLGRADQQIKLRGQRLELGEIEAVLRTHPRIRQCAVSADARSLTAYIVGAARLSSRELRAFLKKRLPQFMIPSLYLPLDDLPLLPNGKIDKRALPSIGNARLSTQQKFTAPRSKIEKQIAALWRELLQVERVGVDDDFFALGGHSLLAVQLAARLRTMFKREITLADLFSTPTVAALAKKLAAAVRHREGVSRIDRLPLTGILPLSAAQEQFFTLDELISGAEFLHLPYAFQLYGPLDVAALRRSLQAIGDRHAVLRALFTESDGKPVQIVRRRRKIACPLRDLTSLAPRERRRRLRRLSSADAAAPFDLAAGPPCRFKLIRLARRRHVLLVTAHHIIADQWSMRLLRAELAQLYGAFARGRPAPLADLPFQFVDFTRWQQRMVDCGAWRGQLDYWKKNLAGAVPRLVFPNQVKRAKASFRAARKPIDIGEGVLIQLRQLARSHKTTPFVVLLAALDAWLFRISGCRDLRVGTLVANRGQPGTENLLGYFVNAVVLRARIAPRMSFAELIAQARNTAFDAFAHQDLPIEELARAMKQKNKPKPPALYPVMLNYRRFSRSAQRAAGLKFASYLGIDRAAEPEMALTSADLSFDFRELTTKLTASVNFKIDRFDEGSLDWMLRAFALVLNQCLARPEDSLSSIEIPALGQS